jgi:hypothetical protein
MAITYRSIKGSPLTSAEIDANFAVVQEIQDNQFTSAVVYPTLADLPVTGTALVSYKVANDPSAVNNGYYHWETSVYVKDDDVISDLELKVDIIDDNSRVYLDLDLTFTPITGKYINSSGVLTTNASWNVNVYSVTVGEKIKIRGSQLGNVTIYGFYSDALCTTLISKGAYITTLTAIDEILTVPTGASYIGVTDKLTAPEYTDLFRYSYVTDYIETLEAQVNSIDENSRAYQTVDATFTTIDNYYINSVGNLVALSGWSVNVYPVTANELIKLNGIQNGSIAMYAFYTDITCTTLVSVGTTITSETTINDVIIVPDGALYIGVTDQDGTAKYTNLLRSQTLDETITLTNARIDTIQSLQVDCYGDSLTAGAGGGGTTYVSVLSSLLGGDYTVNNLGVGGEKVQTIGARQGGIPAILDNDVSIPTDTTPVSIGTLADSGLGSVWDASNVTPLLQGTTALVNPVFIDGLECNLTYSASTYYLARVTPGTAKTLYAGTPVYFKSSKENNSNFVQIIYVGTNGDWADETELIEQINAFLKFSNTKKFIVIGLHFYYPSITNAVLESAMVKAFGNKYFNSRLYFVTNALEDAGITPTAQDIIDIAAGDAPDSLRSDSIHFNSAGYTVLGTKIYEVGQSLGYW